MRRKKRSVTRTVLFTFLILGLLATIAYYISDYIYKPSYAIYPSFDIPIPLLYSIHGIDVSRYQDNISWEEVKKMKEGDIQIRFAFIKATEGSTKVDARFRRNWNQAGKAGIARGAYHYFLPGISSKAQAENFCGIVRLQKGDLPPVLDVEQEDGLDKLLVQQKVGQWLEIVEKKSGVRPVIYSNVSFYEKYLKGKFDHYPLWIAHYFQPGKPRITRNWLFWQHNECGRVNGINGKVDFNVFNGDSIAFDAIRIK